MLNEVVAGVLTDALASAGRRLAGAIPVPGSRRLSEDLALARWFDTYRLTDRVLELPDVPTAVAGRLADVLRQDDVQAVLLELIAARLTDAPEADIERVRAAFELTVGVAGPEVSKLAAPIFGYCDGEIADLAGRLEGAAPAVLAQVRGEAMMARMIAVMNAIERHVAVLSQRPAPPAEGEFLARYRSHVTEHHGKIEPPDFERRRRVPIGDLYVPPALIPLADADPGQPPCEIELWALGGEIDRSVLLGDPGAGKTTAANALMHHYAADAARPVPLLVTLREFGAADRLERSVAGHIEHRLETFYQCPPPPGMVVQLLLTGQAVVIFDGLDELLDTTHRADIAAVIERFATEYPLARLLVTSRLIGYDQARLDDRQFTCYRIGGFTDEQVACYARKWFAQEDDIGAGEAERWVSAFIDESAATADLRANPLVLALMCILYRGEGSLPRNRAEVYEQCANLLFRKWDARRRIHLDLRAGHLLEPALRHLAWWLFTGPMAQSVVTERELAAQVAGFLRARGLESQAEAGEAASEFVSFCTGRMWVFSDVGTTAAGERLYTFTHRTFLEYFAAAQLAFACDTPEQLARKLAPQIAHQRWEVVGELAVQIKDHTSDQGADRIFSALLAEHRRRSCRGRSAVLQFLSRCLRSVTPSPPVIRNLTRQVLDHLFTGNTGDKEGYSRKLNDAQSLFFAVACRHKKMTCS